MWPFNQIGNAFGGLARMVTSRPAPPTGQYIPPPTGQYVQPPQPYAQSLEGWGPGPVEMIEPEPEVEEERGPRHRRHHHHHPKHHGGGNELLLGLLSGEIGCEGDGDLGQSAILKGRG